MAAEVFKDKEEDFRDMVIKEAMEVIRAVMETKEGMEAIRVVMVIKEDTGVNMGEVMVMDREIIEINFLKYICGLYL